MKNQDIIILHGWNLSGNRFDKLSKALQRRGHRVFAPDLPGFGGEPAPKRPWHVVDYAEFVRHYILKKQISSPLLIGHSFGGRVSLKYAQIYPKDVLGLILTGTPGFSPIPKKKLFIFFIIAKVGGLLFSIPPLHFVADIVRRWLYYIAGAREFLHAEGAMRDTFKYIVQDNLIGAMESIQVPCLLLWGEYDVIVPVAIARKMQEVIFGATLMIIPETDHGVPMKEPEIFAQYVERFLKKIR